MTPKRRKGFLGLLIPLIFFMGLKGIYESVDCSDNVYCTNQSRLRANLSHNRDVFSVALYIVS